MNYQFFGTHFFFTKYCENTDIVQATIKRCQRSFKTKKYTVSKRINKVVDELGIVIFEAKKRRK